MSQPQRFIQVFDSSQAVAKAGAELFRDLAQKQIQDHGRFTVALSGGSTPKQMFELLASPDFVHSIDWARIHFFWGDERSVPLEHPDSNYRTAREILLSRIPFVAENVHAMPAWDLNPQSASDYQNTIARVLGCSAGGEPPAFDLIYLGMGADAHTASLFPGTKALGESVQWVVRNEVPKLNTTRMTFTYPLINAADHVCFLVCGADKAEPLQHVLEGAVNLELYPSQGVKPAGNLSWYLDGLAAARLQRRS